MPDRISVGGADQGFHSGAGGRGGGCGPLRNVSLRVAGPAGSLNDRGVSCCGLRDLCRTVTKKGKKTVEVVYLIASDRDADPDTLAAWLRSR